MWNAIGHMDDGSKVMVRVNRVNLIWTESMKNIWPFWNYIYHQLFMDGQFVNSIWIQMTIVSMLKSHEMSFLKDVAPIFTHHQTSSIPRPQCGQSVLYRSLQTLYMFNILSCDNYVTPEQRPPTTDFIRSVWDNIIYRLYTLIHQVHLIPLRL